MIPLTTMQRIMSQLQDAVTAIDSNNKDNATKAMNSVDQELKSAANASGITIETSTGWIGRRDAEEEDYKSNVQTDCRTYFDDGTLTYANRYSIREWSHGSVDKEYLDNDQTTFEKSVEVVNSQDNFNKNATINAIPIIAYHDLDYGERIPGSTDVNLFDAEMKYLHENSFTVLTMADLRYDESTHQLYIKPLD
jgi:hypothetical protein